jgi:hypothetical protein
VTEDFLYWHEPCEKEICGWRCWRDYPTDDHFTKDVKIGSDWGDIDGEGPCNCPHHDEYSGPQEGPEQ